MKKEYAKPELVIKGYAQFENVFTMCDKGNASPQGCQVYSGWPPSGRPHAAYSNLTGS